MKRKKSGEKHRVPSAVAALGGKPIEIARIDGDVEAWLAVFADRIAVVTDKETEERHWFEFERATWNGNTLTMPFVDWNIPAFELKLADGEEAIALVVRERLERSIVVRRSTKLPSGAEVRAMVRRDDRDDLFTQVIIDGRAKDEDEEAIAELEETLRDIVGMQPEGRHDWEGESVVDVSFETPASVSQSPSSERAEESHEPQSVESEESEPPTSGGGVTDARTADDGGEGAAQEDEPSAVGQQEVKPPVGDVEKAESPASAGDRQEVASPADDVGKTEHSGSGGEAAPLADHGKPPADDEKAKAEPSTVGAGKAEPPAHDSEKAAFPQGVAQQQEPVRAANVHGQELSVGDGQGVTSSVDFSQEGEAAATNPVDGRPDSSDSAMASSDSEGTSTGSIEALSEESAGPLQVERGGLPQDKHGDLGGEKFVERLSQRDDASKETPSSESSAAAAASLTVAADSNSADLKKPILQPASNVSAAVAASGDVETASADDEAKGGDEEAEGDAPISQN